MQLDLSDLASIGEIVGAIVVVITLLYVSTQVKDSTRALRSAAVNDANTALQSWYLMMAADPQAIKNYLDGILSHEPLSRDEEFRFMMIVQANAYAMQNSFLLAQEGSLDPEVMAATTMPLQQTAHLPGVRRFLSQRLGYFHPRFAAYIEGLLASADPSSTTVEAYRVSSPGQWTNRPINMRMRRIHRPASVRSDRRLLALL